MNRSKFYGIALSVLAFTIVAQPACAIELEDFVGILRRAKDKITDQSCTTLFAASVLGVLGWKPVGKTLKKLAVTAGSKIASVACSNSKASCATAAVLGGVGLIYGNKNVREKVTTVASSAVTTGSKAVSIVSDNPKGISIVGGVATGLALLRFCPDLLSYFPNII